MTEVLSFLLGYVPTVLLGISIIVVLRAIRKRRRKKEDSWRKGGER